MTAPLMHLKEITKIFSSEEMQTHALRGVSFDVYPGDYLAIAGPSGCGKSTLLSLMGLLDAPTTGHYQFNGQEVSQLSLTQAARIRNEQIGFIFQQFNLIDELNVWDNIALPLRYALEPPSPQFIKSRVEHCLELVQLGNRASHKPSQLSGGQQQRIAIARALVADPAVLLVDEPTGNLDSKNSDAIMKTLERLNELGTTLCIVTHDPRYADMARRQLHLLDGRLLGISRQRNFIKASGQ